EALFALALRRALRRARRVSARAPPYAPVRPALSSLAGGHLRPRAPPRRPFALYPPCHRDRSLHGASRLLDLLRAGAGAASRQAADRLVGRSSGLCRAHPVDRRAAPGARTT